MPGSSPKRKGDGYERELAKYFNEKIFNITQKASKYSFDSRILGNFIINSEMKKNI